MGDEMLRMFEGDWDDLTATEQRLCIKLAGGEYITGRGDNNRNMTNVSEILLTGGTGDKWIRREAAETLMEYTQRLDLSGEALGNVIEFLKVEDRNTVRAQYILENMGRRNPEKMKDRIERRLDETPEGEGSEEKMRLRQRGGKVIQEMMDLIRDRPVTPVDELNPPGSANTRPRRLF